MVVIEAVDSLDVGMYVCVFVSMLCPKDDQLKLLVILSSKRDPGGFDVEFDNGLNQFDW